jgi:dihydrofolate reductase
MAENRVIGANNQLPWHLPADLRHFKSITTGHPILMGRKTYESIGRPLPNRTNFVMTRDASFQAPGCIVVPSLEDAIEQALPLSSSELFIIGGATVYQQALPLIQRLYLTVVHHAFAGDAFFPDLDKSEWKEIEHHEHPADEQNPYAYSFLVWSRIEK